MASHYYSNESSLLNKECNILNQTAPVSSLLVMNGPDQMVENLKEQISQLKTQNTNYIERMARMENKLALTESSYLNSSNHRFSDCSSYSRDKNKANKKMKELEMHNIQLLENNEHLSQKLGRLEVEYDQMKSHLDTNLEKCEELYMKFQDNEDTKESMARQTRKLSESLNAMNHHHTLLQKKVAFLEKENKEFQTNLKVCETEKRNISEKWQKLSKKVRVEGDLVKTTKNFEGEIGRYQKELQECKEKFLSKDAQVRILKDENKSYKAMAENNETVAKDLQHQLQKEITEKDLLFQQNSELMQSLKQIQSELNIRTTAQPNTTTTATERELVEAKIYIAGLEAKLKSVTTANVELSNKLKNTPNNDLDNLIRENKDLTKVNRELQGELAYSNKKWELLVNDYEKLQETHTKLLSDYREEQNLAESLHNLTTLDDENSTSIHNLEARYDTLTFPSLETFKQEILKIKVLDEMLYENLNECLNNYILAVQEATVPKQIEEKYKLLLLKYYKMMEKSSRTEDKLDNVKKSMQSNTVNLNLNLMSTLGPSIIKNEVKVPRLDFDKGLRKRQNNERLNQSMVIEKINTSDSSKVSNQHRSSIKPYFQPLQRVVLKDVSVNQKVKDSTQSVKPSREASKENLQPNAVQSRARESKPKDSTLSKQIPSNLMKDLKNQLLESKVYRSLSNDGTTAPIVQNKACYPSRYISNNDTTNMSQKPENSFHFSVSDALRTGERIKQKGNIDYKAQHLKNKSYLDLYFNKRSNQQKDSQPIDMNSSFNFVSNF